MADTRPYRYFLATPFSEDFPRVRNVLDKALRELGLEPVLLETAMTVGAKFSQVVQHTIQEADLVIVDLTHSNPNVMFEAGFAQASGKQMLFIVQEEADQIPFDIRGNLFLVYDPRKLDELADSVKTWTSFFLTQGNYVHGKAS